MKVKFLGVSQAFIETDETYIGGRPRKENKKGLKMFVKTSKNQWINLPQCTSIEIHKIEAFRVDAFSE